MYKLIDKPFEVIINYEWRESLSYRRHGDDNEYSEYENYFYTILENGNDLDLKKHFKRVNTHDPFEIESIDYFLQFIPPDINRTSSNSSMSKNDDVKEFKRASYLTQRLNERYSHENRKFYNDLKLTSTNRSSLNEEILTNIKSFLEENFQGDIYNDFSLLDNSKTILYITYKDEIVCFCCMTEQNEKTYTEILEKIGERKHNLPHDLVKRQLTLCVTKKEFQNRGLIKTTITLLLKNFFYSKSVWALTNDYRMKNVLRFLGFQEYGHQFQSRRTFNYSFYLLDPGVPDYGRMMYEIY